MQSKLMILFLAHAFIAQTTQIIGHQHPTFLHGNCCPTFQLSLRKNYQINKRKKQISAKWESHIWNVIDELNARHLVHEIYKMSPEEIKRFGRYNAFALSTQGQNGNLIGSLHFSEHWLEILSDQAIRALIGHECMHIILRHTTEQERTYSQEELCAVSRQRERDADIASACALQCAQGGVDLFQSLITFYGSKINTVSQYNTHPTPTERIAYFQRLLYTQHLRSLLKRFIYKNHLLP